MDPGAVKLRLNAVQAVGRFAFSGGPAALTCTHTPQAPFDLGETVIVTVDASDFDGNAMETALWSFTVTDGLDTAPADGLPDGWAAFYGITDAAANEDGDAFTNQEEADLGQDPTVADAAVDLPDAFENDGDFSRATWFPVDGAPQAHTLHELGDADWFVFYGAAEQHTIATENPGPDADPRVALFAEDGLTKLADGGHALTWAAPVAGFYFARVSNQDPAFGDGASYKFRVTSASGAPPVVAEAGPNQRARTGQWVELNGSGSTDPGNAPSFAVSSFAWSFKSRPWGSTAALDHSATAHPRFMPDKPGAYQVALAVTNAQGARAGDGLTITVEPPLPGDTQWVDFSADGAMDGTQSYPFDSVVTAAVALPAGGTIRITSGQSGERLRLGTTPLRKQMRLEANGGNVVLGRAPESATKTHRKSIHHVDFTKGLAIPPDTSATLPVHPPTAEKFDTPIPEVFEQALPSAIGLDGARRAEPDSVLAVRLRGGAAIDPATIAVRVDYVGQFWTGWQLADGEDPRDLWVIAVPGDAWSVNELVTVTVRAQTSEGAFIPTRTENFFISPQEPPSAEFSQPQPGLDYVDDVRAELTVLYADATEGRFTVAPVRVFDAPRQTWLPLPGNAPRAACQIEYYLAAGPEPGWHSAEQVAGWLVPESTRYLETEAGRFIGFLSRHGGQVRLRPAAQ